MQNKALLACALLNAVATAAPALQASSDTPDVQLSIIELKQDILTVINDISQKRDATSDYGEAGRNLHYLVQFLTPHCTSSITLSAASTGVEAIHYLEQTQLTLSIVAQDIINSDLASAAKDVCAAADYYSAAASLGDVSFGANSSGPSGGVTRTTGSPISTTLASSAPPTASSTDCHLWTIAADQRQMQMRRIAARTMKPVKKTVNRPTTAVVARPFEQYDDCELYDDSLCPLHPRLWFNHYHPCEFRETQ
ncbi:hypothetical protein LTR22_025860 [Elasticomyces elasticus]|nr:hypothetical protein LTR22_025860 [Elasticomyces elasticus]